MMWAAEPDGARTWFNHRWLDFTGRTMDDELGLGWTSGLHAEDVVAARERIETAVAERRSFELDYRLRRADGAYRWVLDRGEPLAGQGEAVDGYVGVVLDIDERMRAERELEQTLEALRISEERFDLAVRGSTASYRSRWS